MNDERERAIQRWRLRYLKQTEPVAAFTDEDRAESRRQHAAVLEDALEMLRSAPLPETAHADRLREESGPDSMAIELGAVIDELTKAGFDPDCYGYVWQGVEKLVALNAELRLSKARVEAAKSVLVQGLANAARNGRKMWAKHWLKAADQAARDVRPEDLVRVQLNTAESK